jgi:hypothetical protein
MAAVAAPASVPHKQKKEESGQSAGPSAGPPVLASVPLGGAFRSYTGDGPFWTPHAPHLAARGCTSHAPSSDQPNPSCGSLTIIISAHLCGLALRYLVAFQYCRLHIKIVIMIVEICWNCYPHRLSLFYIFVILFKPF